MNKLIYLASPYTQYKGTYNQAAQKAAVVAGKLIKQGRVVYAPIAHGHFIDSFVNVDDYDLWIQHALTLLQRCDYLYVLTLPGWQNSDGIGYEIQEAKKQQIPIYYIDDCLYVSAYL